MGKVFGLVLLVASVNPASAQDLDSAAIAACHLNGYWKSESGSGTLRIMDNEAVWRGLREWRGTYSPSERKLVVRRKAGPEDLMHLEDWVREDEHIKGKVEWRLELTAAWKPPSSSPPVETTKGSTPRAPADSSRTTDAPTPTTPAGAAATNAPTPETNVSTVLSLKGRWVSSQIKVSETRDERTGDLKERSARIEGEETIREVEYFNIENSPARPRIAVRLADSPPGPGAIDALNYYFDRFFVDVTLPCDQAPVIGPTLVVTIRATKTGTTSKLTVRDFSQDSVGEKNGPALYTTTDPVSLSAGGDGAGPKTDAGSIADKMLPLQISFPDTVDFSYRETSRRLAVFLPAPCGNTTATTALSNAQSDTAQLNPNTYFGKEPPPKAAAVPIEPMLRQDLDRADLYVELLRRAALRIGNYELLYPNSIPDPVWWGDAGEARDLVNQYIAAAPKNRASILDQIEAEQARREHYLIEAQKPGLIATEIVESDPIYRAERAREVIQARWDYLGEAGEALISLVPLATLSGALNRPGATPSRDQFREEIRGLVERSAPARGKPAGDPVERATSSLFAHTRDDPLRIINNELIARGERPYQGMDVYEAAKRLGGDKLGTPAGRVSKGAGILKTSDLSIDPETGKLRAFDPQSGKPCDITEAIAARRRVPAEDTREAMRSYATSTRAAMGEWAGWMKAIHDEGEIGLQGPGKSSAKGVDFITAVKNGDGTLDVFITDVKSTTTGTPGEIRDSIPDTWMNEVNDAVRVGTLDLGDAALERSIRGAVESGRVRLRRITVDYSRTGQGKIEGFRQR